MATIRTGSTSPACTDPVGSATLSPANSLTWISPSTPSPRRERPVRHHARDGRSHGLTGLKFVHVSLPRVGARALDRQRERCTRPSATPTSTNRPYEVTPTTVPLRTSPVESCAVPVRCDRGGTAASRPSQRRRDSPRSPQPRSRCRSSASPRAEPTASGCGRDGGITVSPTLSGRNERWPVSLASSSSIVTGSMDTLGGQPRVVPRTILQTGGAGG
jgi:hypothetical protein